MCIPFEIEEHEEIMCEWIVGYVGIDVPGDDIDVDGMEPDVLLIPLLHEFF